MNNIAFVVSYLGDNPPSVLDIEEALKEAEIDKEGIIQVEKISPIYEICEYCQGTGNEGTMTNIDCGNCGGSGWGYNKRR